MNRLRTLLLGSVSAVALTASALAADLPVKAPPRAPVEVWNWTGPYIGINAGAAWNSSKFADLGDSASSPSFNFFTPGTAFWSTHDPRFTIGGQVGYNWQSGNIVYGLEGDMNWVDGKTHATLRNCCINIAATTDLDWFATLRGRIGVAFSAALLYATGGLAIGHFHDVWGSATASTPAFDSEKTRTGWTLGGGLEYMLTRNWTIKAEGLYADFGNWIATNPNGAIVPPYRSRFTHTVGIARAGLNWKW